MTEVYQQTASPGPEPWAEFEDPAMAEGFTMIPNVVIRNPDLSDGAVRLYGLLLSYAWQDGFCFPGQERLATDCGKGVKAVYRLTKELEGAGLVRVQHRPLHKGVNRTNLYTFKTLQPSTSGTDQSKMSDPDRSKATDDKDTADKNPFSPPYPPEAGGQDEGKKKAGLVRGPSDTSSPGAERKPAQNRAGEGRDRKRSPRKRKPRGGVTSPAGIEAILSYKARRDIYDPIGLDMESHRKQLASIAERWDFASEEDPPMKLRYEISTDREGCDRMLKRLRRMVRAADRSAQLAGLPGTEENVSPPGGRAQPADSTSLPSTRKADPNPLEAILDAEDFDF